MGRSTRQCGPREETAVQVSPQRRGRSSRSCLPEPQYGRTAFPRYGKTSADGALPVRIQVVPRKRFALSPHGDQGFFVPLTREKEVVYERVIVSLCQSHHL